MKRKSDIDTTDFDRALSGAYRGDPDCGAFGAFDDLKRRRMINDILETASTMAPRTVADRGSQSIGSRIWIVGATAAVVGFLVFGVLFYATAPPSRQNDKTSRESYFGEVQEHDGDLFLGDKRAFLHAPIPIGQLIRTESSTALLRLPTGIQWRMEQRGHAKIMSLDSKQLEVRVMSGESWFRVDPGREGPSFSVDTKMGRIDIRGTIFVVNAGPADVRVTLLKGEVWVTRPSGRRDRVKAGYTMHLSDGKQHLLTTQEERRLYARLTALNWDSNKTPREASSTLERRDTPDVHKRPAIAQGLQTRDGDVNADLHRLHREIQTYRKKRDWDRVTALYKKLIRSAPGSETAIVSRVSLGEIYLSKLHQGKNALAQFDRYLRSGHTALLPEAFFGKCNALRALGEREREAECLHRFIQRFADAFQAKDARARLEALHGEGRI